jgi:hypothetical protein
MIVQMFTPLTADYCLLELATTHDVNFTRCPLKPSSGGGNPMPNGDNVPLSARAIPAHHVSAHAEHTAISNDAIVREAVRKAVAEMDAPIGLWTTITAFDRTGIWLRMPEVPWDPIA